jgi:hypothetical protein
LIIVVMGCGKCVMYDWCRDYLDPGKRVSDNVLAGYVVNVRHELGNEVQMVELPW